MKNYNASRRKSPAGDSERSRKIRENKRKQLNMMVQGLLMTMGRKK